MTNLSASMLDFRGICGMPSGGIAVLADCYSVRNIGQSESIGCADIFARDYGFEFFREFRCFYGLYRIVSVDRVRSFSCIRGVDYDKLGGVDAVAEHLDYAVGSRVELVFEVIKVELQPQRLARHNPH